MFATSMPNVACGFLGDVYSIVICAGPNRAAESTPPADAASGVPRVAATFGVNSEPGLRGSTYCVAAGEPPSCDVIDTFVCVTLYGLPFTDAAVSRPEPYG